MKSFLIAFLLSLTAAADTLTLADIQSLMQRLPPGHYQGISDEKKFCSIWISYDENTTSYTVNIAPPRGGGNMLAEFTVRPGQELSAVQQLFMTITEGESSFSLAAGANGYKSLTVINRKGEDRSYGLCSLK
jgi:hypothetical protein